jgi:hypothetical protein
MKSFPGDGRAIDPALEATAWQVIRITGLYL